MNNMAKPMRGRSTAAIDDHIGARIRERRVMLGVSQQQLAEMISVTYQQAHKYERGINRVSAGRLGARADEAPLLHAPVHPTRVPARLAFSLVGLWVPGASRRSSAIF